MDTPERMLIWLASGLCLVAAVLAMAVLHWSGHAPSRTPRVFDLGRSAHGLLATLAWLAMWMIGLFASALLLVLGAALTVQLTQGMNGLGAATTVSTGESKDAVSNAMSAVALVLTAMSLVLTLGATWLGKQLRLLEAERRKMADSLRSFEQWQVVEGLRQRVQAELIEAREAGSAWVIRNGSSGPILTERLANLGNWLERLSSPDRRVRRGGFDQLAQLFDGMHADPLLEPIRRYGDSCHELALSRVWSSGEVVHHAQHEALVRAGLWCRIFDPEEQRRSVSG